MNNVSINLLSKSFSQVVTMVMAVTALTLGVLTGCQAETQENTKVVPIKTATEIKLAAATTTSSTTTSKKFIKGVHYVDIFPELRSYAPQNKVEVTELFWYGCPHCYSLEPTVDKFLKNKPEFIEFTRVPATLNPRWTFHAKAYYLGQLLDPKGKKGFHKKIFHAMQVQGRSLHTADALQRYFLQLGVSKANYDQALASVELKALMERANVVSYGSQADSVPTIIINGKYRTTVGMAQGYDNLLELIHQLAKAERK